MEEDGRPILPQRKVNLPALVADRSSRSGPPCAEARGQEDRFLRVMLRIVSRYREARRSALCHNIGNYSDGPDSNVGTWWAYDLVMDEDGVH